MNAKFKINIHEGIIEIEGDENFVEKHINNLQKITQSLSGIIKSPSANLGQLKQNSNNTEIELPQKISYGALELPETFGEWMHKFKEDINDLEKALLTAFFVQAQSETKEFKTIDVNRSLKEHGIKLSNPSVSLNRLSDKKLIFQTKKAGSLKLMRVSKDGEELLKGLLRESAIES